MRKNSRIFTLAMTAAVMMAVTACGSKNTTTLTTAETTETTAETGALETTASEETSSEDTNSDTDMTDGDEEDTEESAEETTASEAGIIETDGTFIPASGKYEITPPAGWTLDESSDTDYATFLADNEQDMLELVSVSGDAADGLVEILPATAEEYKKQISRDDGMDIIKYDVKTKDDGSQTFQYAIKYTSPSDGVYYMATSGSYDVSKKIYICATGTVTSDNSDVIKQVQDAVDSFKIK